MTDTKQLAELLREAVMVAMSDEKGGPVPEGVRPFGEWLADAKAAVAAADELEVQEPDFWVTEGIGWFVVSATLQEAKESFPDREHRPLYRNTPPASETPRHPQDAAPQVPDGYALVPVELTKAMRMAFHDAHEVAESISNEGSPDCEWNAMLKAAPQPGES